MRPLFYVVSIIAIAMGLDTSFDNGFYTQAAVEMFSQIAEHFG